MNQNGDQGEKQPTPDKPQRGQWQRFLAVVYRLVIIFGLVLLALGAVLVILTSIIPFWSLAFPMVIIIIGLILARVEYNFHKRLNR